MQEKSHKEYSRALERPRGQQGAKAGIGGNKRYRTLCAKCFQAGFAQIVRHLSANQKKQSFTKNPPCILTSGYGLSKRVWRWEPSARRGLLRPGLVALERKYPSVGVPLAPFRWLASAWRAIPSAAFSRAASDCGPTQPCLWADCVSPRSAYASFWGAATDVYAPGARPSGPELKPRFTLHPQSEKNVPKAFIWAFALRSFQP